MTDRADAQGDMSMTDYAGELSELVKRIKAHIDQQFATGRTRVFLSSLGSELSAEKQRTEEISGLKFAEFVRTKLDYPMGITGEHQNVLFIVPPGASTDVSEDVGPRYNMSFWTAFAKPLPEGEERFINLSSLRFGVRETVAGDGSDDVREIQSKFVATEQTSRNLVDMHRRIDEWLSEQALDRDRFLAKARRAHAPKTSLLAAIIESLSEDQLRRTTLPLDVIKSLLG